MRNLILISLFCFATATAQTPDTIYLDKTDHDISKEVFKSSFTKGTVSGYRTFHNVTTVKLFDQQNYGTLTPAELTEIRSEIGNMSGSKTDSTQTIAIEFFDREENCWKGHDSKRMQLARDNFFDYFTKMRKMKNVSVFFVSGNPAPEFLPHHIPLIVDGESFFKNRFFPYVFQCGSALVIHASGNYYLRLGEHPLDEIVKVAKIMDHIKPKH